MWVKGRSREREREIEVDLERDREREKGRGVFRCGNRDRVCNESAQLFNQVVALYHESFIPTSFSSVIDQFLLSDII